MQPFVDHDLLMKLREVSLELDPFTMQSQDLAPEVKDLLKQFKLLDLFDRPFEFTNQLLKILVSVENKIEKKSHVH